MPTTTTNKTLKLGLSQYSASEKPNFLTNYNSDMKDIDDSIDKANGIAGLNNNGKLNAMPTASDVGAVPVTRTLNTYSMSQDITLRASDVDAVPITRKINEHNLTQDLTLNANDIGAIPLSDKDSKVPSLDTNLHVVQNPASYKQANGIAPLNSNTVVDPQYGGTGQKTLASARNVMGLGNTTGALPIANGGTNAIDVSHALQNFGLNTTTIFSGAHYILQKTGKVMNLRMYGVSANSIPQIDPAYRPTTVDASSIAWVLGDTPQAGFLIVSGYSGLTSSYAVTGPETSTIECRGSVTWIIK